jgi:hypothetical protein
MSSIGPTVFASVDAHLCPICDIWWMELSSVGCLPSSISIRRTALGINESHCAGWCMMINVPRGKIHLILNRWGGGSGRYGEWEGGVMCKECPPLPPQADGMRGRGVTISKVWGRCIWMLEWWEERVHAIMYKERVGMMVIFG